MHPLIWSLPKGIEETLLDWSSPIVIPRWPWPYTNKPKDLWMKSVISWFAWNNSRFMLPTKLSTTTRCWLPIRKKQNNFWAPSIGLFKTQPTMGNPYLTDPRELMVPPLVITSVSSVQTSRQTALRKMDSRSISHRLLQEQKKSAWRHYRLKISVMVYLFLCQKAAGMQNSTHVEGKWRKILTTS